jgi:hypothetical protein
LFVSGSSLGEDEFAIDRGLKTIIEFRIIVLVGGVKNYNNKGFSQVEVYLLLCKTFLFETICLGATAGAKIS